MAEELFPAHAPRRVVLDHTLNHVGEFGAHFLQTLAQSIEKGFLVKVVSKEPVSKIAEKSQLEMCIILTLIRHDKLEEKQTTAININS